MNDLEVYLSQLSPLVPFGNPSILYPMFDVVNLVLSVAVAISLYVYPLVCGRRNKPIFLT